MKKLEFSVKIIFLLLSLLPIHGYGALNLTLNSQPNLGMIFAGNSGRQFVLNTSGVVSGTHASDHISGQAVGQITVSDTSYPAAINIEADSIFTSGGLSVNQILCSYNSGVQTRCDNGGMSATSVSTAVLKIGVDVTTSNTHAGNDSASVSMDITVSYL